MAYGDNITQLIRYSKVCSNYYDFLNHRACDCYSTPSEIFFSYIMAWTSYFLIWWDLFSMRPTQGFRLLSIISLKQKSTERHVGGPWSHYHDSGSTSINMEYLAGKVTNTNYIVFSLTSRLHLLNKYLGYGYKLPTQLISLNKCYGHHHELVDHYRMCMS